MVTIEEERKTLEYQETMNLDIENIASSSQQIWRSIYEVIDDTYLKKMKLFPTEFLDHCKKKINEPQNIPSEFKTVILKKALEQGLYTQVVMIRRKESDYIKEKYKTKKYNFQGQ